MNLMIKQALIACLELTVVIILGTIGCGIEYEDTTEVLGRWEHEDITLIFKRTCPSGAIGHCELDLFDSSDKSWWSPEGKWILNCTSAFADLEITFLEDSLLLLRMFSLSSNTVDPLVIINLAKFHGMRSMTARSAAGDWESINVVEHKAYSFEVYQANDDENDFSLNIWKNDKSISQRNLFILDAQNVIPSFVEDSLLELSVVWSKDEEPYIFYFKLWREGNAEVEVFYEPKSGKRK